MEYQEVIEFILGLSEKFDIQNLANLSLLGVVIFVVYFSARKSRKFRVAFFWNEERYAGQYLQIIKAPDSST